MKRRSFIGFLLAAPLAVPAMAAAAPVQRWGLKVDGVGYVKGVVLDDAFTFEVVPFTVEYPPVNPDQLDLARKEIEEAYASYQPSHKIYDTLEISGPGFSETVAVRGQA